MKKIALIIAHKDYQAIEYGLTKTTLEKAGINVTTVSDEPENAIAHDGSNTSVDLTIDQLNPADYDGLFLIGGPGALDCLDNYTVHSIMQQTESLNLLFGAICISPRILAKAEVLGGKNATGWDKDNKLTDIFNTHVVNYIHKPVVIDGKIVTAVGPEATQEFANAILELL